MNDPFLQNTTPAVFEEYYSIYKTDPESLDPSWRYFFMGLEAADGNGKGSNRTGSTELGQIDRERAVLRMIEGYRTRGHLFTKTNPVRERRHYESPLTPESFGLETEDLTRKFRAGQVVGLGEVTLGEIIAHLDRTYCSSVAIEYKYLRDPSMISWLEKRMETTSATPAYSVDEKKDIYSSITGAVQFERFLQNRFPGQKRFSVEGVESMVPALEKLVETGARHGIREVVLGMAHRGRLNVLANIMRKPASRIFYEFGGDEDTFHSGDVRYHLGYSVDRTTRSGRKVHISLSSNPSHLETVDGVVEGIARARLEIRYGNDENSIVPVLIHGDAAIAGQGIVYEVIQMSDLPSYRTGGTVHVILNNQIGFTTGYQEGRSSTYCTDVAKTTLSPVFHVNGDDVEAVAFVMELALEFRQTFHQDVFIDVLGYRKHGHNESDEPGYTQPILYSLIKKHPDAAKIYRERLIKEGSLTVSECEEIEKKYSDFLESEYENSKQKPEGPPNSYLMGEWSGLRFARDEDFVVSPPTGIHRSVFDHVVNTVFTIPEEIPVFPKIRKIFEKQKEDITRENRVNWSGGEALAFGSLLMDRVSIRMSGQDSRRGTFSQRHAVLTLEDSREIYTPLEHLAENQGTLQIHNSILSEYGVLAFEAGYAMSNPGGLTIWEAQFGDFVNGAQILIDEFLAASEEKWQRMSGLVLMLPHGFEGQGPDHSSGRPERFLSLAARNNFQIVNLTTPANLFHVLRRQLYRPFRKPLIIFTPKSLLRHPLCVSPMEDFLGAARFHELIDDLDVDLASVDRVLVCSGKVYYDLLEEKQKRKDQKIAILRAEQLYPFPEKTLRTILLKFSDGLKPVWVQEEPINMGSWSFLKLYYGDIFSEVPVARSASASPATGYLKKHAKEQEELVERAFDRTGSKH